MSRAVVFLLWLTLGCEAYDVAFPHLHGTPLARARRLEVATTVEGMFDATYQIESPDQLRAVMEGVRITIDTYDEDEVDDLRTDLIVTDVRGFRWKAQRIGRSTLRFDNGQDVFVGEAFFGRIEAILSSRAKRPVKLRHDPLPRSSGES